MKRLRWSYADIVRTPVQLLLLCEEFGWSHADLVAMPSQAVRDFNTIFNYEQELAKNGAV